MKIEATITNVVREGNGITVFAQFPEGDRNYSFPVGTGNKEITRRIREDVKALQKLEAEASVLKDELIGVIID